MLNHTVCSELNIRKKETLNKCTTLCAFLKRHRERKTKSSHLKVSKLDTGSHTKGFSLLAPTASEKSKELGE